MKQEIKENRKKLDYNGGGIIRVKCDCNADMNLILKADEISICGHCKKEVKIEIYQVEVAKGTSKKKYIENVKPFEMPEIKTKVNTELVQEIKKKIYAEEISPA